jgi:acyl-CoA thioester hydrolase
MQATDRTLLWSEQLVVRWSDLDANGHVNNAVFFTYCEQSRIDWMHSIAGQTTADGYGAVVKKTSCTYLRPVNYPATLEVKLFGGKPGRTSFPTYSEIWNTVPSPEKVAEGEAIMVWVHRTSGEPHPVPDFLRKLMPP